MADDRESTESVNDGKANIEEADKLYSQAMTMAADWNSVNDAKAEVIIERAKDAVTLFGKTNHEKKVDLRRLIEKCEAKIPPDSFDSLKKRAEKAFLRIVYPKNPTLRNTLFLAILLIPILTMIIPAFIRNAGSSPQPNNANAANMNAPLPQVTPAIPVNSPGQIGNAPAIGNGVIRGPIEALKATFNTLDRKDPGEIVYIKIRHVGTGKVLSNLNTTSEEWKIGSSNSFTLRLNPAVPLAQCDQLQLEVDKTGYHAWEFSLEDTEAIVGGKPVSVKPITRTLEIRKNNAMIVSTRFDCEQLRRLGELAN